jgi:hypothetical protein
MVLADAWAIRGLMDGGGGVGIVEVYIDHLSSCYFNRPVRDSNSLYTKNAMNASMIHVQSIMIKSNFHQPIKKTCRIISLALVVQ